jgi:rod shape-determining protein MreC
MRNLIGFFIRSRIFLLFLFLQVIALILTINSRSFQRASFLNSSSELTGGILESYNNYSKYLNLNEQNERLATENAKLHSLLKKSYLPITKNTTQVEDTLYKVRYQYINANVINSSFLKSRNFITLDRGNAQGIETGMGVIGPDGVVGIVKDVSDHFSTVIPLINPDISISGSLLGSNNFGPVKWEKKDYLHIHLSDIPRHASFNAGDSVITNSKSRTYPPGILIGTVQSSELQSDQNFYRLKLKLSTDFSALQHVYVIKDKMKLELQEIEENLAQP